jgi:hypothetical protein
MQTLDHLKSISIMFFATLCSKHCSISGHSRALDVIHCMHEQKKRSLTYFLNLNMNVEDMLPRKSTSLLTSMAPTPWHRLFITNVSVQPMRL